MAENFTTSLLSLQFCGKEHMMLWTRIRFFERKLFLTTEKPRRKLLVGALKASYDMSLVEAENISRRYGDLAVLSVDNKFACRFPLIGYRELHLLVDVTFKEPCTIGRRKTLFGQ